MESCTGCHPVPPGSLGCGAGEQLPLGTQTFTLATVGGVGRPPGSSFPGVPPFKTWPPWSERRGSGWAAPPHVSADGAGGPRASCPDSPGPRDLLVSWKRVPWRDPCTFKVWPRQDPASSSGPSLRVSLFCGSWWRTWGSGCPGPEALAAQRGLDGAVVWDVGILLPEWLKATVMAIPHTHTQTQTGTRMSIHICAHIHEHIHA